METIMNEMGGLWAAIGIAKHSFIFVSALLRSAFWVLLTL